MSNIRWSIVLVAIFSIALLFSSSCSERKEPTVAPGSTLKADRALNEAEKHLRAAGILLSFGDLEKLARPEDLVPNPQELASAEKQGHFKEAVRQLDIVISELEQESDGAPLGSISDRGLVHFYLGLAYLFDAISRLQISDDPEVAFTVEYNPDPSLEDWFTFDATNDIKKKLDMTENPLDYPLAFTAVERQAIIDAADLIGDVIVKPAAQNIQPQASSVDQPPYSGSAMWHFRRAANLLGQYSPYVKKAVETFNERITNLESEIRDNTEKWGFFCTLPPWE